MDKKILLATALLAAALLAACGDEPVGAPPAVPPAADDTRAAAPGPAAVWAEAFTPAADALAAGHCALDAINGGSPQAVALPATGSALFGGWVADAALQVPADALFVLRGATASFAAPLSAGSTQRPDVAQALGSEALAGAGFDLLLALDGLPAGSYELSAVVDRATQATCSFNATLVIQ
ncbi:hypothetical protein [Luteimonas sp. MC1895]|uniref:hypothetical protein n=1 Tax=Luteimonas sp. MC1895 TaxID=2819513 RepID=UPI0018F08958|nr:hypothetical protein [Luteimonas sp. MC1895]MBJ6978550.1 hypothetical protein [Luteimonas sp. MC1895]